MANKAKIEDRYYLTDKNERAFIVGLRNADQEERERLVELVASKKEPVYCDDITQKLDGARAIADAIYNQDPECDIGHETLFNLSSLLVKELDDIRELIERHWREAHPRKHRRAA